MISTKPYLVRAIFDWANDNSFTPQVLVNAEYKGVEVPIDHILDGQIVLNISLSAIKLHVMDDECLSFSARFNGLETDIFLPMDSILAIFARENSRGIFFEEGHDDDPESGNLLTNPDGQEDNKSKSKSRNNSHLKIIK